MLRRFSSITSTIKEPDQIAEWVTEQITHVISLKQDGLCAAAQYDLTGHVLKRASLFQSRVPEKKIEKLLESGQYIHLDKLGLDDFDTLVLSRIARFVNPRISLLDLNSNPDIKDAGGEHIARHVIAHTAIQSLFLSGCGLTDAGVTSIAASVSRNKDLGILELRKNAITDEGVEAITSAVLSNSHVRPMSIYLSGNLISDKGALSLAKAVLQRPHLKFWAMDSPAISQEAKEEICRYTRNVRF